MPQCIKPKLKDGLREWEVNKRKCSLILPKKAKKNHVKQEQFNKLENVLGDELPERMDIEYDENN